MGGRKKKWEVIKSTKREFDGVNVDGGRQLDFGTSDAFTVSDPGVARAIEQSLGQKGTNEVVVVPTDDTPVEPGHNYHFGWSRQFESAWERVFG